MRTTKRVAALIVAALSLTPRITIAQTAAGKVEDRRKALDALIAEQWEYTMKTSPEFASILGDKRYNDRLSDANEKAIHDDLDETRKFLAKFEAVDTTGFPEQEQLNKALMVRDLKDKLDGARFEN